MLDSTVIVNPACFTLLSHSQPQHITNNTEVTIVFIGFSLRLYRRRRLCFLWCACWQIMTYGWLMCESTEGTWWKAEDWYSGPQYLGFISWHIGRRKGSGDVERSLQRDKLRHSELASIRPDKDNEIHGNSTALLVFRTGKVARGYGMVTHVWH